MTIIYSDDSGPIIWPITDLHDPSSKKYYFIDYRPAIRISSKEYVKGMDVVVPTTSNGCMYECVSGGISASTSPTFLTEEGKTTIDGDVVWKCKPLISRLSTGDTITVSTWTGDVGVIQDNPLILSNITTGSRVTSIPVGATSFTITNHITILRLSGRIEEFDKSAVITIANL
jgi:hypothetical protein